MNDEEKLAFKQQIKETCAAVMQERINTLTGAMQSARESANSEDKSSAGDKYEVGRAMGHLQEEMLVSQVDEANNEMALINSLNTDTLLDTATTGAVVMCRGFVFFIAVGLGSIMVKGQKVVVLSPVAPLAVSLLDKRSGDAFVFNKNTLDITEVF